MKYLTQKEFKNKIIGRSIDHVEFKDNKISLRIDVDILEISKIGHDNFIFSYQEKQDKNSWIRNKIREYVKNPIHIKVYSRMIEENKFVIRENQKGIDTYHFDYFGVQLWSSFCREDDPVIHLFYRDIESIEKTGKYLTIIQDTSLCCKDDKIWKVG
jgi:hypothetical protein